MQAEIALMRGCSRSTWRRKKERKNEGDFKNAVERGREKALERKRERKRHWRRDRNGERQWEREWETRRMGWVGWGAERESGGWRETRRDGERERESETRR